MIELLVVIAIIALLLSVIAPALRKAKQQAQLIICGSNQRQIVQGVLAYASSNNSKLPPAIAGIQSERFTGSNIVTDPSKVVHWHRPTAMSYAMNNPNALNGGHHGRYLLPYLDSVDVYSCPMAPLDPEMQVTNAGGTYTYQKGYQEMLSIPDCTYTLLWNYQGFDNAISPVRFVGPGSDKRAASNLLITDTAFFSNNYTYGYPGVNMLAMTHPFEGASKETPSYPERVYYLKEFTSKPADLPVIWMNAGYLDGRVERFSTREMLNCKNAIADIYLPTTLK